jgi:hypothetical protein
VKTGRREMESVSISDWAELRIWGSNENGGQSAQLRFHC